MTASTTSASARAKADATTVAPKVDPAIPAELRDVTITRVFDAPRDLVWKAWTDAKHIAAWWGPHGFDAPHPSVDLRVGGHINFDMRAPDGTIMPVLATIREITPPERLVFTQEAKFGDDPAEMRNEIVLTEEKGGKTKLTLRVVVLMGTAAMLPGLKGMRQGWGESLDKMGEHLDLMRWGAQGVAKKGADGASFAVPDDRPVAVIRRTFDAPRDLVWKALTDPKMRAQWWGPRRYTANVRELDVRVGGTWRIDHGGEDGKTYEFWGEFKEVRAPQRLVNTFCFEGFPPAVETATLFEADGKTTLTIVTSVDTMALRDGWVASGMEGGARESMERLAELLPRMKIGVRADEGHKAFSANQKAVDVERKVSHATFRIERTFDAPPQLVFNAFANEKAKDRWFVGPPGWDQGEKSMDFRVGGREVSVGGPPGGVTSKFYATYYDIVPNERIVYVYEMYLDDARISVSVATIEFKAVAGGTRLVLTEQGAFLDGFDNPALREEGTRGLLEQLAQSLKRAA